MKVLAALLASCLIVGVVADESVLSNEDADRLFPERFPAAGLRFSSDGARKAHEFRFAQDHVSVGGQDKFLPAGHYIDYVTGEYTRPATNVIKDGEEDTVTDKVTKNGEVDLKRIFRECPRLTCDELENVNGSCPFTNGICCAGGKSHCCPHDATCLNTDPPTCVHDTATDVNRCAVEECKAGHHCPHGGVDMCCVGGDSCCAEGYMCKATNPATCIKVLSGNEKDDWLEKEREFFRKEKQDLLDKLNQIQQEHQDTVDKQHDKFLDEKEEKERQHIEKLRKEKEEADRLLAEAKKREEEARELESKEEAQNKEALQDKTTEQVNKREAETAELNRQKEADLAKAAEAAAEAERIAQKAKKEAEEAAEKDKQAKAKEAAAKAEEIAVKEKEKAEKAAKAELKEKQRRCNKLKRRVGHTRSPHRAFTRRDHVYSYGWNFVGSWSYHYQRVVGDFNGDGKDDIAKAGPHGIHYSLSLGNGDWIDKYYTFPGGWNFGWSESVWATFALDLDGDGKADLLRAAHHAGHMLFSKFGGNCMNREPHFNPDCFSLRTYHNKHGWNFNGHWHWHTRSITGDFNGDGKEDFAHPGPTDLLLFISKGDGTFWNPHVNFNGWNFGWGYWQPLGLDITGECKSDLLMLNTNHVYSITFGDYTNAACLHHDNLVNPNCYRRTVDTLNGGFSGAWGWNRNGFVWGDFDGDGKGDFAHIGPTYTHYFISQGNGQFWKPIAYMPNGWNFGWDLSVWNALPAIDVDGDGLSDLIRVHYTYLHGIHLSGSVDNCYHRNGWVDRSCFQGSTYHLGGHFNFQYHHHDSEQRYGWGLIGDFNGDERDDFLYTGSGRYIYTWFAV